MLTITSGDLLREGGEGPADELAGEVRHEARPAGSLKRAEDAMRAPYLVWSD